MQDKYANLRGKKKENLITWLRKKRFRVGRSNIRDSISRFGLCSLVVQWTIFMTFACTKLKCSKTNSFQAQRQFERENPWDLHKQNFVCISRDSKSLNFPANLDDHLKFKSTNWFTWHHNAYAHSQPADSLAWFFVANPLTILNLQAKAHEQLNCPRLQHTQLDSNFLPPSKRSKRDGFWFFCSLH